MIIHISDAVYSVRDAAYSVQCSVNSVQCTVVCVLNQTLRRGFFYGNICTHYLFLSLVNQCDNKAKVKYQIFAWTIYSYFF